jgi:mannose-6-phosphate isomerase-like protein (cupin superfamily)
MHEVRRVVTGHSADGKAVFASDDRVSVSPLGSGSDGGIHQLWGGDEPPTFPDDGAPPGRATFFPGVGGYRFLLVTMPPAGAEGAAAPPAADPPDPAAIRAQMERVFPGLASHMEPDNPGMHTTDTIDFEYVVSGEVVLELDDGAEVVLHPGDTVVQNGTRHRWHNRTNQPAAYVAFIVGAHRK